MKRLIITTLLVFAAMASVAQELGQKYWFKDSAGAYYQYLLPLYWIGDMTNGLALWDMEVTNGLMTVVGYGSTNYNAFYTAVGPSTVIVGTNQFGRVERALSLIGGTSGKYPQSSDAVTATGLYGISMTFWVKLRGNASADYLNSGLIMRVPNLPYLMLNFGLTNELTFNNANNVGGTNGFISSVYLHPTTKAGPSSNTWYFMAGTWMTNVNSGYPRVYVNGVEGTNGSIYYRYLNWNAPLNQNPAKVSIGDDPANAASRLAGEMDDCTIWTNRCLTSNEIWTLYLNTHPTNNLRQRPQY